MAFSSGSSDTDFSEINITPLTDVFLILFLIMIVIAPLINQTALKIDPPKAQHGKAISSKVKAINLEIDAEGMIAINNKKLSDKPIEADRVADLVKQRLTEIMQDPEYKDAPLNIVADSETKQKYMVGAMDAAAGLGLSKMNIVTVSGM
jgi:biopolymer transport protein ExbD/biopolymer transport protein TolR